MTALHWAVQQDYPNLVRLLLKSGADPNAKSKFGETPLSIAEECGYDDIRQMLLEHEIDMSVTAEEQQEATDSLMIEMEKDHSSMKQNSLGLNDDSTTKNLNSTNADQQNG